MHRLLVADRAAENGPISVMGVIMEYYSMCDPQCWIEFVQCQLFSYHSTV